METNGSAAKTPSKVLSPTLTPKQNKATNMQRTIDEMRTHISRLKTDLEGERSKNKQLHRDKVAEIKHVRENSQSDKDQALETLQAKLEHQKQLEIQKARDAAVKEKDQEIRQLRKYHDEELRTLKTQLSADKEDAISVALEMQKHLLGNEAQRPTQPQANSALVIKLQREVKTLKETKQEVEQELKVKVDEGFSSKAQIDQLTQSHVTEIERIKKDLADKYEWEMNVLKGEIKDLQIDISEIHSSSMETHSNMLPSNKTVHSNTSLSDKNKHSNHESPPSNSTEGSELHSNDNSETVTGENSIKCASCDKRAGDNREHSARENNQDLPQKVTSPQMSTPHNTLVSPQGTKLDQQQHVRLHEEGQDKERHQQKKITDLTMQLNKLEKRAALLRTENDSLKKSRSDEKSSEDKIKKLKKRNAELAAIARRLEEKAKQLQTENNRRKDSPDSDRRSITKIRGRELAELSHKNLDKERELELEQLKQKCQFLSAQLTKSSILQSDSPSVEKEELENIIRKAAKERLKLERQILEPLNQNSEVELQKIKSLEETNQALQGEVGRLLEAAAGSEKLEIEVTQRRIQCENLETQIEKSRLRCRALEGELQEVIEKNTQLTIQNSDLQQRINQLEQVNEECRLLRNSLTQVQQECDSANKQVNGLTDRVTELSLQVQTLRDEVGDKDILEREHSDSLQRLRRKEEEMSVLQQQHHAAELSHQGAVSGLQSKLESLERAYAQQAQQHSRLTQEMDTLRREAELAKVRPAMETIHIQTETPHNSPRSVKQTRQNSPRVGGRVAVNIESHDTINLDDIHFSQDSQQEVEDSQQEVKDSQQEVKDSQREVKDSQQEVIYSQQEVIYSQQDLSSSQQEAVDLPQEVVNPEQEVAHEGKKKLERRATMDDIDSLDSSYEEEVETAREVKPQSLYSMVTGNKVMGNKVPENTAHQSKALSYLRHDQAQDNDVPGHNVHIQASSQSADNVHIPDGPPIEGDNVHIQPNRQDTAGLPEDIMDRDQQLDDSLDDHEAKKTSHDILDIEIVLDTKDKRNEYIQSGNQPSLFSEDGNHDKESSYIQGSSSQYCHGDGENDLNPKDNISRSTQNQTKNIDLTRSLNQDDVELQNLSRKIDELSTYSDEEEEGHLVGENENIEGSDEDNNNKVSMVMKSTEDVMSLSMDSSMYAKKSPFQVYIAKYHYDPEQFSPNENPDAELLLNIGDYIFVYGNMDEDGFFEGELMDGRRGLVPSNFVEKVPDEELEEFHSNLGFPRGEGSMTGSMQQDLEFNSSDENHDKFNMGALRTEPTTPARTDLQNMADIQENGTNLGDNKVNFKVTEMPYTGIACPVGLKVDRQLHNSVLISWLPPVTAGNVQSYHVYMDKQFRTSVKGSERTKALLEGIDLKQPHRVSVRTVSTRGESTDAMCVITIGKDAALAPSDLTVSSITSTSAVISWLPSNNSYGHVLSVDGCDMMNIKPNCYESCVAGLKADTSYRVTITTRVDESIVAVHKAASVTVHTLEGGIPDAPLDVQVESGPQEGTLLITWLPVTITTSGKSNGAKVTGYSVYVDGQRVTELPSPTGDHAVLTSKDLATLLTVPQNLTVRTVAIDNTESPDSQPAQLTSGIVDELTRLNHLPAVQHAPNTSSAYHQTDDQKLSINPRQLSPSNTNDGSVNLISAEPVVTPAPAPRSTGVNSRSHKSLEEEFLDEVKGVTPDDLGDSELSDIAEVDEEEENHTPRSGVKVPPRKTSSPRATDVAPNKQPKPTDRSPRIVQTKIVDGGHMMAPHVAFRPVQDHSNQLHGNQPHGSQLHSNQPNSMAVPHIQITKDSSGSFSDDVSPEKPPVGMVSHEVSHDPRQRRPKSVPGSYRGDGYQGAPRDNELERSGRPKSAKVIRSDGAKKRDYFEKHEIENREKYEPDARNGHNRSYDEESYHSYSALEDNNKVTRHRIQDDLSLTELIDYEDDGGDSLIDSVPEMEYDDSRVRIFIALFDYDPNHMSPNPDAADEELPFKEGQLIKIYGEKDPDGFFMGEANGRRGFVPCNMVSEVQVDDPDIAAQLLKESNRATSSHLSSRGVSRTDSRGPPSRGPSRGHNGLVRPVARSPRRSPRSSVDGSPFGPESSRKRMVAMYDYDPTELSPNLDVDVEIPFRTGDMVVVYGEMDEDGFYYAEVNGRHGLVPSNFLQELPPQYDPAMYPTPPRGDPRHSHPAAGEPPRPRSREQHPPGGQSRNQHRESHPTQPHRDYKGQKEYGRDHRDQRDYPRDQKDHPRDPRNQPRDQRDHPQDQRNHPRDQRDRPRDQKDHPRDFHKDQKNGHDVRREDSRTPEIEQPVLLLRGTDSEGGLIRQRSVETPRKHRALARQMSMDSSSKAPPTSDKDMPSSSKSPPTIGKDTPTISKAPPLSEIRSLTIEDKTQTGKTGKKRGLFSKGKAVWKKIAK